MSNKYQNGKIYRLTDNAYTKIYYGSTCETLAQRMARHRSKYYVYLKGGCTKTTSFDLFDEFGINNCKIELVELYPTNSKEELRQREGHYIENYTCINKYLAGRNETFKEYYQRNKPACQAQRREYKQLHKEEETTYHKKLYQEKKHVLLEKHLCGCGVQYTFQHKKRHETCKKHQEWLKQQEPEIEPQLEELD